MYEVHISQRADKFLGKLDKHIRERIIDGLKKLAPNPIPKDSKFIIKDSGNNVFSHRIGNFRAMYKINRR